MELFVTKDGKNTFRPLAERMRPQTIVELQGQEHILGEGGALTSFLEENYLPSIILWGPPGTGKTTIANLLSNKIEADFIRLSAIESGVKEIRSVIEKSKYNLKNDKKTVLFIDEIHRFNKSQQDALLHSVEDGSIILIGATTENPSFEVNSALLSRCRVFKLNELSNEKIKSIILNSLEKDEFLKKMNVSIKDLDTLVDLSGGDARTALNILESLVKSKGKGDIVITKTDIERIVQKKITKYDKDGENHYDTISAFIKSMRGSDPDGAIFWLAKMIDAGEDPKFIARRMIIFASEDIGNADPFALVLANNVFEAVNKIGMPESRIILSQGVIYLATAEKSNASYLAIDKALDDIRKGLYSEVPLHLRNAPTKMMKEENYGLGYKYPHDFENNFVEENYLPEGLNKQYYAPKGVGREEKIKNKLDKLWFNFKININSQKSKK